MNTVKYVQSPARSGYPALVSDLAIKHRAKDALRQLMAVGADAVPALVAGLRDPSAEVRVGCCVVLDHHMDESALPALIENLRHSDEEVRGWALHALACDRCKEGACRPAEDLVIPIAIDMLLHDSSRRVRQRAAGSVGECVHRHPAALAALLIARERDPHPVVRKIARWYTPGGPIYKRLAPKQ